MLKRNITTALYSGLAAALIGLSCTTAVQSGPIKPLDATGHENRSYVDPPVAGMRLTSEQKDKYLKARRMSANVRQRCVLGQYVKNVRCNESVPIRITAVEGAKHVSHEVAPLRPQFLAWIENLSSLHTTFDSIKPGAQTRYALVATTTMSDAGDGIKRPDLVLVEFDKNWTLVATHPWSHIFPCHKYLQPFRSEADFRRCTLDPDGAAVKTSLRTSQFMFASRSAPTAMYNADDPLWFSCSGGCCTSGNRGVEQF